MGYKRIMMKLSGEALMGGNEYGICTETLSRFADDLREVKKSGIDVCVVVGGGNIFRGISGAAKGMDRATADYMGMLATVMNALGLQGALEAKGMETRVQSAIPMSSVCEPYIRRRAIRHLERGRVVIFGAGTGNPFFTTDTAAALRAVEMGCDGLFKATKVDGVYSEDPMLNPKALRHDHLSYQDVLAKDLRVMDAAAISLARDNKIPVVVFSIKEKGNMAKVVQGSGVCTTIKG